MRMIFGLDAAAAWEEELENDITTAKHTASQRKERFMPK